VDELNSVSCGGTRGVSDTFASALWALDSLFALDQAGVDGVNIHVFPGAHYGLFSFARTNGGWSASVTPEYYGLLMFARAAPPGSRLIPVAKIARTPVKVWATMHRTTIRVVLINEGAPQQQVLLSPPAGASGPALAEQLLAPSLDATSQVTLGGQTFGSSTDTGILPEPPQTATIWPQSGAYPITLPPASATLLKWTPGPRSLP
jgi:hypothetical protein